MSNNTAVSLDNLDLMSADVIGDLASNPDGLSCTSAADANRLFGAMKGLEREITDLERQRDDILQNTKDFYNGKISARKGRIEYLESLIKAFVQSSGESVSVPNGRAYTREDAKWDWTNDRAQLVEWAKQRCPDKVKTVEKVSKNDIKAFIKDNGLTDVSIVTVRPRTRTIVHTTSSD
jgi:hypothetical protein